MKNIFGRDPLYVFGCRKHGGVFRTTILTDQDKGSSWKIIRHVALGITCTCCLYRLGAVECSIKAVLVTDYSPYEREKKKISRQNCVTAGCLSIWSCAELSVSKKNIVRCSCCYYRSDFTWKDEE